MQLGLQYILWCQQKRFLKSREVTCLKQSSVLLWMLCCLWTLLLEDWTNWLWAFLQLSFVLNGLRGSSKNVIVIFLVSEYWTSTWVYQCLNEGLSFWFKWQLLHSKYVAAIDCSSFLLHLKQEKYEFMVVISNISPSMVVDTNCVVSWVSGAAKTLVKSFELYFYSIPSSVQTNVVLICPFILLHYGTCKYSCFLFGR